MSSSACGESSITRHDPGSDGRDRRLSPAGRCPPCCDPGRLHAATLVGAVRRGREVATREVELMDKADELIEAIDRWGRHRYHVAWDERDVITYAIASGADLDDLPLLWEQAPLQVLPSFVTRLGGTSIRDFVEPVIPLGLM